MHETTKSTGTQYYNKPTLIGHILAHIAQARKVFEIKSHWYGGPHGLEYDARFPKYVFDICKKLDEKYSTNQSREYSYRNIPVPTHEPIWNNGEDNCGSWPSRNYDGDMDTDEGNQIRIWVNNLDYMLRDSAITYTGMLRDEKDNDERSRLTLIIIELWDFHAEFEMKQQEHYRRKVEVKSWIMDWLWERGEVTTNITNSPGMVKHGKIHAQLKRHDGNHGGYAHGYGDTLPEAVHNLWQIAYKREDGVEA